MELINITIEINQRAKEPRENKAMAFTDNRNAEPAWNMVIDLSIARNFIGGDGWRGGGHSNGEALLGKRVN